MKNTHALVQRTERGLVVVEEFPSYDEALQAFGERDPEMHAVRSSADPSLIRRAEYLKLDKTERGWLLDIGRKAGDLESAKDAMFDELLADVRFEHLDVIELSSYAWAAAKFCFPREARSW